nr:CinA family protein [Candidatus Sigynarchaeota archaeon]
MNKFETLSHEILDTSARVVDVLARKKCMLGISESVTGGTIASFLTRIDGCSKVLFASQVLYSTLGKSSFCNIPLKDIEAVGTVSEAIIGEMMMSMAKRFFKVIGETNEGSIALPDHFISLATSGVAGASIEGLPRGTVIIGISRYRVAGYEQGTIDAVHRAIKTYHLAGDRIQVMLDAVKEGLILVENECLLIG